MVSFILGNKDQFVAIQGDAGTGKTYAAKVVKHYLETYHKGQEIIGLSFTGKASQGLEDDTKIKSRTAHSFLANEAKEQGNSEPKNRLIIVDEAGMLGSNQMNELVENAKKNGDRIVFMGDTKQFKSISAGNIFNDMQKYGTKTVRLSQAMRFESELTKEATTSLKMEMVKKSLDTIKKKGTLQELSRDNQVIAITKNYSSLKPKERKETLIIASTNKDKEAINWTIRGQLGLGGNSYKIQSHASLNGIESHYSQGYEVGLRVSIQGELEGFKSGQKLYVTGSIDDKIITVKGRGKRAVEKQINVYEHGDKLHLFRETEKPFVKGEVVVFTKNTVLSKKSRVSVKNGERTRIKSINKHGDITTTEGKKFNINDMPYLDHGYAITDVKSQGSTYENVMIMAKAEMASFHSFYTQITRAKKGIELFTDNKELLETNVLKESTFKTTLDYTIKEKKKEPSKEVTQPKEKSTYKDISTDKYVANPMDVKKSTESTLKRVGVHQSNLDSEMKIDIYRKSIGKLDGVGQKTTITHKKYRGIEVAKKQQKEQTHGQTGRDTKSFGENILKAREDRAANQEPKRDRASGDKERSASNQSSDARSRHDNGRSTGEFTKVDESILALNYINSILDNMKHPTIRLERVKIGKLFEILSKHYGMKKINMSQVIESIEKVPISKESKIFVRKIFEKWHNHRGQNNTNYKGKGKIYAKTKSKQELRKLLAKVGILQSNDKTIGEQSFYRDKTSMRGLSKQYVDYVRPKPRVFLSKKVHESMGGRSNPDNGVRRERDIDRNAKRLKRNNSNKGTIQIKRDNDYFKAF